MSVHYKFKAALDFSTVTFDGIHISVSELKKSIVDQKRLGKNADFDLQIINAQTKEVYSDENTLIPKNTSVIVARVPIADRKKSGPPPPKENAGRGMHHRVFHQQTGAEVAKGSDLSSMDLTEEEKIKAMMTQSTADYDPSQYVRVRGRDFHGKVPDGYRCNRCGQTGHWIQKCPNAPPIPVDVKKSTGIPRSFMVVVDSPNVPGALITPEGRYAVPAVDHAAYAEKGKSQQPIEQPVKPKIPDDLLCALCKDLLTDALLIPCCANSYCDDCIRSHLVESEHTCPGCGEKDISPTTLIPNRFLRLTVNAFKSESGYSKPEKIQEKVVKPEKPKEEEPRKLSLDELPDDLFPHSPKKVGSEAENQEGSADPDSTKDIYDFNDGSIPSPFASPKPPETRPESAPTNQQTIQSLSRPFPVGPPPTGGMRGPVGPPSGGYGGQNLPNQSHHHHMHRNPPQYNEPPPQMKQHPHGDISHEPPPPGFEVLPPGEDRSHRPPLPPHGPHGSNGPPLDMNRDQRQIGPPPTGPPGQQLQGPPGGPPPFNPMQPPPEFQGGPPPPHGMPPGQQQPHGPPPGLPPPGYGGPPPPHGPGPHHPNMPPYSNNFGRGPPPHMNRGPPPMHHGGPPHPRHPMDHHDDFGPRGRGRRPYGGPPPPMPGRLDDLRREEPRPGTIDDPLKEFERIMREKDRRKKMAAPVPRRRSKSRSISPPVRREPYVPPKRSRSRSFSRSPSPKRKRPLPGPKRRRSYSRTPSRSPPPIRRTGKSRSRSRNRSLSPSGKQRRSPRRAPPQYSPSPPPSRFARKDKDEYFDGRGRDRDRDRSSRYPPKHTNYSSREYDGKYDNNQQPLKHEGQPFHKYEGQRPPPRNYGGGHGGHGIQHEPPSSFNKPQPLMDSSKGLYEFDSSIAPPGTENSMGAPPSLLDINVQQPHPNPQTMYSISTIGSGVSSHHHHQDVRHGFDHKSETEKSRSSEHILQPSNVGSGASGLENKGDDNEKEHRRKKSPIAKKHKKDKKKHKKRNKEDKKEKKSSKSRVDKSGDGEKSSEDEAEPEPHHETVVQKVASDTAVPLVPAPNDAVIEGRGRELMSQSVTANANNNLATIPPSDLQENSNGAGGTAKLTAPCDSTVKSPERLTQESGDSVAAPLKDEKENHQTESAVASHVTGLIVPDHRRTSSDDVPVRPPEEELHLPTSKWDEYEDFIIGGEPKTTVTVTEHSIPNDDGLVNVSRTERKVTSEVLKRAEHAIFEKSSPSGLPELSKTRPEREEILHSATVHQQVKPDLKSSVASTIFRKSAKDRLGSKVSEDDVTFNASKVESGVPLKSKVAASSGDSSRRRRSRSRSQPHSGRNYRNRSRSKSTDRNRGRPRQSPDRQRRQTPLERDLGRRSPQRKSSPHSSRTRQRERRSVSKGRREDRSNSRNRKDRRRSPSPERKRAPSRERRRRSPSRERKPDRDRERERGRKRSNSNEQRRKSRSIDRDRDRRRRSRSTNRRQRSPEQKRSASRERNKRSISSERYASNRQRSRSPYRRPSDQSRMKADESRGREALLSDRFRINLAVERKDTHASAAEEPPSPEASVFQQMGGAGGYRADQLLSPSLKKQKGRINIKLSSIAKTDQQASGSSSSDDDHDNDSKHSDSDEDGKKRTKKRRHSSTSTKSSASDSKKKKKKKDKKKKKKKKKSK